MSWRRLTLTPNTGDTEVDHLCGFEASLVYAESPGQTALQRKALSRQFFFKGYVGVEGFSNFILLDKIKPGFIYQSSLFLFTPRGFLCRYLVTKIQHGKQHVNKPDKTEASQSKVPLLFSM